MSQMGQAYWLPSWSGLPTTCTGEDMAEAGNFDGSAVLAYVFPTDLPPDIVGSEPVEGILALVASSHPAFDDTPLWDESDDGRYSRDGGIYHAHWVASSRMIGSGQVHA